MAGRPLNGLAVANTNLYREIEQEVIQLNTFRVDILFW